MLSILKKMILFSLFGFTFMMVDFNTEIIAETEPVIYMSAAEYDYPPFSIENNGQADGFSIQLLKAVAVEMGITIEFKMDYCSIIKQELIDGQLDVLPLVGYTIDRDDVLDFTIPYIVMRGNIFVRDDTDLIQSVDDLFGKQVLVLSGDNSQEYAISIGLDEELIETATYTEAFQLLSSGLYDAVLAQGLVGEKIIYDEHITNVSPVYVYDDQGINKIKLNLEGYEQKFCFAVTEGNHELLSILNEGLSIVSANGTYDELYQEWFPFLIEESTSIRRIVEITLMILIPLIIITLASSVWFIRRQVKEKTKKIIKNYSRNQIILDAFKKKFDSNEERYNYFLAETMSLSESEDGIMFTLTKDMKVIINAVHFGHIVTTCTLKEMSQKIEDIFQQKLFEVTPIQIIFNEFNIDKYLPNINIACLQNVQHTAILSFETEKKDIVYTLIANKQTPYTTDDLTQISILISGFMSMINNSNYLEEIEFISYHDKLTSLYNRRYVEEWMQKTNHAMDYPISVIFADVNGLKEINDNHGHMQGDLLLKKTGELIKLHTNEHDIVARWGGDEFVIIKPKTTKEDAKHFIHLIHHTAEEKPMEIGNISIAFGFTTSENKTKDLNLCLMEAEKMMYENKYKMTHTNH